jgi:hypothetical protein
MYRTCVITAVALLVAGVTAAAAPATSEEPVLVSFACGDVAIAADIDDDGELLAAVEGCLERADDATLASAAATTIRAGEPSLRGVRLRLECNGNSEIVDLPRAVMDLRRFIRMCTDLGEHLKIRREIP